MSDPKTDSPLRDARGQPITLAELAAQVNEARDPYAIGRYELWIGPVRIWCQSAADAAEVAWQFDRLNRARELEGSLSKPLAECAMGVRARKVLQRFEAVTLGDVTQMTVPQLLSMKGVAVETVNDIRAMLREYGLHLRSDWYEAP